MLTVSVDHTREFFARVLVAWLDICIDPEVLDAGQSYIDQVQKFLGQTRPYCLC